VVVALGATVITDGWTGYLGIDRLGYNHDRRSQRATRARGEHMGPGEFQRAGLGKFAEHRQHLRLAQVPPSSPLILSLAAHGQLDSLRGLASIHRSALVSRFGWVRSEVSAGGHGGASGLAAGGVPLFFVPLGWM
jgi:hypothetical protein